MAAPTPSTCPTTEQLETLFQFLEEHRDLARGVLRNVEGRVTSRRLWGQISDTLNDMGGCIKTIAQWQRVWTDKKYLAKKNIAASRRSASATGGGPAGPEPSRWDLRVLSIMGEGFGEPQTTARVEAFPVQSGSIPPLEPMAPSPSTSREVDTQEERDLLVINEPQQLSAPETLPSASAERPATQSSTRLRRQRRLRSRTDDSVRNRFFNLEEQRVAQQAQWASDFAAIRTTLETISEVLSQGLAELCAVLRELSQRHQP